MPDHFERLGLPRRFSVDLIVAEREYLARSRLAHPDFHHGLTAAEQADKLAESAALNDAYATLKDAVRRAEYLLGLLGGPPADGGKVGDPTFLMAMMDMRDRLEAGERADVEAELVALGQADFATVERLFAADPPDLTVIRAALNRLKTIASLHREARA